MCRCLFSTVFHPSVVVALLECPCMPASLIAFPNHTSLLQFSQQIISLYVPICSLKSSPTRQIARAATEHDNGTRGANVSRDKRDYRWFRAGTWSWIIRRRLQGKHFLPCLVFVSKIFCEYMSRQSSTQTLLQRMRQAYHEIRCSNLYATSYLFSLLSHI